MLATISNDQAQRKCFWLSELGFIGNLVAVLWMARLAAGALAQPPRKLASTFPTLPRDGEFVEALNH
jgi:hypothetical protein